MENDRMVHVMAQLPLRSIAAQTNTGGKTGLGVNRV